MFQYRPIRYYQSQPGLTSLSLEEVEHLVELARGRREDALWVIPLAWNALLWLIVMGPVVWLTLTMLGTIGPASTTAANASAPAAPSWSLSEVGAAAIVGGASAVMLVVSAVVWVWIRRRLVMRSIRVLLAKSACPFCDFDLRGLRVADGAVVRCPECGQVVVLSDHGMTRRDLSLDEGFVPMPVSPLWHTADAGPPQGARPRAPGGGASESGHAAKGRSSSSSSSRAAPGN